MLDFGPRNFNVFCFGIVTRRVAYYRHKFLLGRLLGYIFIVLKFKCAVFFYYICAEFFFVKSTAVVKKKKKKTAVF